MDIQDLGWKNRKTPPLSSGERLDKCYIHNIECPECHQFRNVKFICKFLYELPLCKKCSHKKPRKELIGLKFGHLTVIAYNFGVQNKKRRWKCQCDCGNIIDMRSDVLINRPTVSCGCKPYIRKKKSDNHRFTGFGEMNGTYMSSIRNRAKDHGFEFNITAEYVWDVYLKQNKKCIFTDLDLYFNSCSSCHDGNASVDRIDSNKGYIEGNIQLVHKNINFMKQAFTSEYFIEMCKLVVKNNS